MALADHPRLYVSPEHLDRLRKAPRLPVLRVAQSQLESDADEYAPSPEFEWERNTHNAHLIRARHMQTRVVTLLARWLQTDDDRYRAAAMDHVRAIGDWAYWSWITWRQGNADPLAIYDLSYGENSATLAIAYDWLAPTLSDDERQTFRTIALERSFKSFLHHTKSETPGKHAWWYRHQTSNWNTVCAGGGGMLALALHEELPEAKTVLERAERSVGPYFETLTELDGAWPEGIGYWNYGMRYGFMYLLSHERATGRKHPLLHNAGVRKTLRFPLDFAPHGIGCSFGDVNHWSPLPFHYAVAEHLKLNDVLAMLDHAEEGDLRTLRGNWPTAAELRMLHPGRKSGRTRQEQRVARLYKGQDWAILADRLPDSNLYASIRGGTTDVPHGHRDLMSFHCVVGDEALVPSVGVREYLDTTFSSRRWELPETMPATKNTILINGVGVADHSRVKIRPIKLRDAWGYRIDASDAMGQMRDGPVARFCGRVILMLKGKALLVVDRVELPQPGRMESRLHTYADATLGETDADLKGERQRMRIAWASNEPGVLMHSIDAPTTPGPAANRLRWLTRRLHHEMVIATLLAPGGVKPKLALAVDRDLRIEASSRGWAASLSLSPKLLPKRK